MGTSTAISTQSKHYMRYLRHDEGKGVSIADIARSEGVTEKAIEKSIKQIRTRRAVNSLDTVNTEVHGFLLGNMPEVGKTMKRMLNAKNYVERRRADDSSELVAVPDNETQLKALDVFGKYVTAVQPKAGMAINLQQNNNTAVVTNARSGGFVDRLTEIKKRVQEHNLLPPVSVDAPEADPADEVILDGEVDDE